MSFILKHKITNSTHSMIYSHWLNKIVKNGEADKFIILEYPDLVQLLIIHPDGKKEKDRIIERNKAEEEIKKYPNAFDFDEIDVKELIANDIKRSKNSLKNGSQKLGESFLSKIFRIIRIKIYPKITLTKKPIVDLSILIIGTIISYGILKYILKWI